MDLPQTTHPAYYGLDRRVSRAGGDRRYPIQANGTPSMRWDPTPSWDEGLKPAVQDHLELGLQLYFSRLAYLFGSQLCLKRTSAPDQVTSAPDTAVGTEEAHAAFLAGMLCTTEQELVARGGQARWYQVASGSHMGRCFQATSRLPVFVNAVDSKIEGKGNDTGRPIFRDFGLQLCILVAGGRLDPPAAFEAFCRRCDEHIRSLMGAEQDGSNLHKVFNAYTEVSGAYVRQLNGAEKTAFCRRLAFCNGDYPVGWAELGQIIRQRAAKEIVLRRSYGGLLRLDAYKQKDQLPNHCRQRLKQTLFRFVGLEPIIVADVLPAMQVACKRQEAYLCKTQGAVQLKPQKAYDIRDKLVVNKRFVDAVIIRFYELGKEGIISQAQAGADKKPFERLFQVADPNSHSTTYLRSAMFFALKVLLEREAVAARLTEPYPNMPSEGQLCQHLCLNTMQAGLTPTDMDEIYLKRLPIDGDDLDAKMAESTRQEEEAVIAAKEPFSLLEFTDHGKCLLAFLRSL